jgi:hypothetical protein
VSKLLAASGQLIGSGVHPGLSESKIPLWRTGSNIMFSGGYPQPEPGHVQLLAKLQQAEVRGMLDMERSGKRILYWGSIDKLFTFDDSTNTVTQVGTGYGGLLNATQVKPATRWSLESWGKWALATNGIDAPQIDKAAGAGFVPLTGLPYVGWKPEIFIRLKQFMIGINWDDGAHGGKTIWWCRLDNVEDWALGSLSSEAGELPIRDTDSALIAAIEYGEHVAMFTENRMFIVSFIGAPLWIASNRVLTGVGCFSKHCVTQYESLLYGFGPQGFWVTDGGRFEYLDIPSLRDYIFKDFNYVQSSKCVVWVEPNTQRVFVHWCSQNSTVLNRSACWHIREKVWGLPGLVRSAAARNNVFDHTVVGDSAGDIWLAGYLDVAPDTGTPLDVSDPSVQYDGNGFGEGAFGGLMFGGNWSGDG